MTERGDDLRFMQRALELAQRGQGCVEPNPMVGCVIARDGQQLGEGWHRQFGQAHAEVEALSDVGAACRDATAYVTLEPCCHHGKTPPCTHALIAAGVRRVVVAMPDPFPQVAGAGIRAMKEAGLIVETGLGEREAIELNAPYLKLVRKGQPWIIAKWAMTLDGKLATRTGDSQWISNEVSRSWVHALRGRMDAILVGRGTAATDDPSLTAHPSGPRVAVRVVLDTLAQLPLDSQLVRTAADVPLCVATGPLAQLDPRQLIHVQKLRDLGVEVLPCHGESRFDRWKYLLQTLGGRHFTNLLVEGGSTVLGMARDTDTLDEVHVFIAPKVIGGAEALTPMSGEGALQIGDGLVFAPLCVESLAGDLHAWSRRQRSSAGAE